MRSPSAVRPSSVRRLAVLLAACAVLVSCEASDEEHPVAPGAAPLAAPAPHPDREPVAAADAEPTADACPTLRRLGAAIEDDAAVHGGPEAHRRRLTELAGLFDELAPQVREYGSPRDLRRGDIMEEVARAIREHTEDLLEVAHGDAEAMTFEELLVIDDLTEWLGHMLIELWLWGAETCGDLPGVSRSEINGVPHTRIEIGEG